MDVDTIIRRLADLGISMLVRGERLQLRPGSSVPSDLEDQIRLHKPELLSRIGRKQPTEREFTEIVRSVQENGYVLLWSNVLSDTVAFVGIWEDSKHLPISFTAYTLDELMTLFGSDPIDEDGLRRIHQAKRFGGRVTDVHDQN